MTIKKTSAIFGFILILVLVFYLRVYIKDLFFELKKITLPDEITYNSIDNLSGSAGINLAVPFSSQAPYGDWDLPYLEACEETSALLVDYFYRNEKLSPKIVKREILQMVDWENKRFGYHEDTTAQETATLLKEYFGYQRVDVIYDFSFEDIKEQILSGRPVIVPVAGRLLNNQFYKQPGPIYHTVVVKGLTKDGNFITNDVGTKRGHNYVYDATLFYDAIHDGPIDVNEFSSAALEKEILTSRKAMIVVYPNEK
ncbi:C39 family peptidase [Patescibacteria group bacterium]|nr:C39 family peptidase [Patescibacteria group bacterium]